MADTTKSPKAEQSGTTSSLDMEQTERYIDPVIQKRTILKLDTVVLGCFGIMYLLANLDRNNLVSNIYVEQMASQGLTELRVQPTSWDFRKT